MQDEIVLKKIEKDNLLLAAKIQNTIFPEEDGTENFVECVEKNPYRKEMDYYIAFVKDTPVGITGIYSYHEYPETAWLAWFGVLPEMRNKGYGERIFDMTVKLAVDKGYEALRLYSDDSFLDAHKLYKKKGMIQEVYDNPDDISPYDTGELVTKIFSMSLNDKKIEKWNNKILGLKEQGMKEHQNIKDEKLQVTIEMASSINGIIATEAGSEDFLLERNYQIMLDFLKEYDCLVWGNTTFENVCSWGDSYINDLSDTEVIIFSRKEIESNYDNVTYCNSLESFLEICKEKNIKRVFVSGGAHINTLFMKNNLADKIIINYNPYVLNKGINLFEGDYFESKLELEKIVKEEEGIVQIWYNVVR